MRCPECHAEWDGPQRYCGVCGVMADEPDICRTFEDIAAADAAQAAAARTGFRQLPRYADGAPVTLFDRLYPGCPQPPAVDHGVRLVCPRCATFFDNPHARWCYPCPASQQAERLVVFMPPLPPPALSPRRRFVALERLAPERTE